MSKVPLSYHDLDFDGLHEVLKAYAGRNHEDLVSDFEAEASRQLLNRSVVAVSSGTAALHLALAALDLKPGDAVAVPTFAYVAAVNPILYEGAKPVFIDAEAMTWNLDPELLERALKKFPKLRAIVVVHNYGVPAQMQRIMALARKYRVPVIEDAAEAWGATVAGVPCGLMGDLGVFSFNSNKTVTALGGGLVTAKSKRLLNRVRHLAAQARLPKPYYLFDEVGYNYRLSPLVAAYGLGQLHRAHQLVTARQEIFKTYCEGFNHHPQVSWATPGAGDVASRWLSAFRFSRQVKPKSVVQYLERKGVEVRRGWNPLHTMKHLSRFPRVTTKLSEQLFQEVICLPSGVGSQQAVSILSEYFPAKT